MTTTLDPVETVPLPRRRRRRRPEVAHPFGDAARGVGTRVRRTPRWREAEAATGPWSSSSVPRSPRASGLERGRSPAAGPARRQRRHGRRRAVHRGAPAGHPGRRQRRHHRPVRAGRGGRAGAGEPPAACPPTPPAAPRRGRRRAGPRHHGVLHQGRLGQVGHRRQPGRACWPSAARSPSSSSTPTCSSATSPSCSS